MNRATVAATMFEWSAEEKGDYTHGVSKNVSAWHSGFIVLRGEERSRGESLGFPTRSLFGKIFSGKNFLRHFFPFLFSLYIMKFKFTDPGIARFLFRYTS